MQPLHLFITAMLIVLPMAPARAQMNMDHKKMDMTMDNPTAKEGTAHKATGVVKSVDRNKGIVTLAHNPIKSLNWPAMTMDFQVRDKASLATLKPEQKIEFELVEEKKGSYVISRIK
jgi:Cu/Ag efflux protein CusF